MPEIKRIKRKKRFILINWLIPIAVAVIAALIVDLINYAVVIKVTKNQVAALQDEMKEVSGELRDLNEGIAGDHASLLALQNDVNNFSNFLGVLVLVMADGNVARSIRNVSVDDVRPRATIEYTSTDQVGTSAVTGKTYVAEELIDERVLLCYEEDGCTVFFYGAFNENYHWNGSCLINKYRDGKLEFISYDAYDDGNLLAAKQV